MQRITKWLDIQPGDVGFIAGRGFVSEAIERLTARHDLQGLQTPSHAFMVLSRTETFEALEIIKKRDLQCYRDQFAAGNVYIYRPECPVDIRRDCLARLVKRFDRAQYGWGQIVGFIGVVIRRWLLRRNTINLLPVGTICSELVSIYLRDLHDHLHFAGYSILAGMLDWVTLIPQDSIDPALEMAGCQRDRMPDSITGG